MRNITILIHCKDQKGIIAAVTNFILKVEGNITYIDQHVDVDQNVFFMRLECELMNESWNVESIKTNFQESIANDFDMSWQLYNKDQKTKNGSFCFKIRALFI